MIKKVDDETNSMSEQWNAQAKKVVAFIRAHLNDKNISEQARATDLEIIEQLSAAGVKEAQELKEVLSKRQEQTPTKDELNARVDGKDNSIKEKDDKTISDEEKANMPTNEKNAQFNGQVTPADKFKDNLNINFLKDQKWEDMSEKEKKYASDYVHELVSPAQNLSTYEMKRNKEVLELIAIQGGDARIQNDLALFNERLTTGYENRDPKEGKVDVGREEILNNAIPTINVTAPNVPSPEDRDEKLRAPYSPKSFMNSKYGNNDNRKKEDKKNNPLKDAVETVFGNDGR